MNSFISYQNNKTVDEAVFAESLLKGPKLFSCQVAHNKLLPLGKKGTGKKAKNPRIFMFWRSYYWWMLQGYKPIVGTCQT